MRVLITGAYGFIGSHIAAHLYGAGHDVVAAGRDVAFGRRAYPQFDWIASDFNRDISPDDWRDRLKGVDAVINCVGILQDSLRDKADAVHRSAPEALFKACAAAGVSRVIQISAIGAGGEAGTAYAASKAAGDAALEATDLNWVIVRPSLVYGRGSYGGTALIRGLAGLPFVTPLISGTQMFQPIHVQDVARCVEKLLAPDAPSKLTLEIAGPEEMSMPEIVRATRTWLGFGKSIEFTVPFGLVAMAARFGDVMGWFGSRTSFRTTSLKQMARPITADIKPMRAVTGIEPLSMTHAYGCMPAHVQDRWHARLYFLKPVARVLLALFWMASGLMLLNPATFNAATAIITSVGLPWPASVAIAAATFDTVLGALLLLRWRPKWVLSLMALGNMVYLIGLALFYPAAWLEPLGPAVKTIPIFAFTLMLIAIEDER